MRVLARARATGRVLELWQHGQQGQECDGGAGAACPGAVGVHGAVAAGGAGGQRAEHSFQKPQRVDFQLQRFTKPLKERKKKS